MIPELSRARRSSGFEAQDSQSYIVRHPAPIRKKSIECVA